MADNWYVIAAIALMALLTLALRALPFVAGQWLRRHAIVARLGAVLPLAIMVLLLADALIGQARSHEGLPWPEALASLVVIILQLRTRLPLLSILAGTAIYLYLRNF